MSEWRETTLADACSRVDYGYTASSSDDPGLPRLLRITDIAGPHLDWSTVPGCVVEDAKLSRYAVVEGDIVVARTGATVGHAKRIRSHPTAVFASYLVRFRPAQGVVPAFLGAVVESRLYKTWVQQNAGGAAQPNASAKLLGAFPLRLPDERTQQHIGFILDALDDLIENNRRRVGVLEKMVRTIYREWFVHFRYVGHENASFVDSVVGRIPEGWLVSTCGEELSFIGGGTPSKKVPSFWEGGTVRWYTPSDLTKNRWRYAAEPQLRIAGSGVSNSSARFFPAGSVLMTSRATLGVLAIATTEATTNQGFIVVLPDARWSPGFIREWLDAHAEELAAIGTGATFKEITKGAFSRFRFVLPPQEVLDAYRSATDALEEQIQNLERKIRNLAELRDRLLPRLITGQLDVSKFDVCDLADGAVA